MTQISSSCDWVANDAINHNKEAQLRIFQRRIQILRGKWDSGVGQ